MAGARIEFEVDTTVPSRALGRTLEVMGGDGLTLLLQDIGEYLLGSTRDRAEREEAPDGSHWRALEPTYAKWKAKKRPGASILKFDYHMLGDRLAWQVDGTTLFVGTSVPYGAIHQFGGKTQFGNIPSRPWLGISDADANEIVQLTQDHLRAALTADSSTPS